MSTGIMDTERDRALMDEIIANLDTVTEDHAHYNQIKGEYDLAHADIHFDSSQERIICSYQVKFNGVTHDVVAPVSLQASWIFRAKDRQYLKVRADGRYVLFLRDDCPILNEREVMAVLTQRVILGRRHRK